MFGIALAAMVAVSVRPEVTVLAWIPVAGTIGLAFGLPALAIVVPHAIVWRRLMRRSIHA